jgi:hypothetical protein
MALIDNSSGNPGYIAAIQNSEMIRQSTESSLQSGFAQPGSWTAETVTGSEPAALAAAITAASIADYRRRVILAAQYGQNDSPWREALRVLGTGGV